VGASGSGKTLLLRAIASLDPVEEGEITFSGKSLQQWRLPDYRTKVAYLPQRPALFPGTVEDNLRQPFELAIHRDRGYSRPQILSDLEALHWQAEFLSLTAATLSGGESQILALLRSLQLNPKILLLDEPTASLDADSARQVEILLDGWLQAQPDRACIWTSHNSAQIRRVTHHQIQMPEFLP
jgi:putative ABC transport system ATP-binding protein